MADTESRPQKPEVARVEWAVGALGATIVIAVLGVLAYEAAVYRDGAPALVAQVVDVTATEAGHVVRFRTENHGPSTAAEVVVRATLTQGDRTLEEVETTLDYVARKSSREAGVIFKADPATATLDLRATAYRKP
ncbi:TIGR02588 family protein [Methylopila turkensis]|uniref:TIGR02588 family protein n=1 Tax=Methylopila turkensis TaxID=1437816 RepID=A0A9W6JNF4_9HYPH|nr:TIGR02588 family protein [Methylopila turkensis]GLK79596.1 hypothetical protein GCM10008174_13370 [Methylopila turkensis]